MSCILSLLRIHSFQLLTSTLSLILIPAFPLQADRSFHSHYVLNVTFNPDSGYIYSKTEIHNPADSCFLIAKCMKIHSVIADGKSVRFRLKPSALSPNSSELSVSVIPEKITITYSGQIRASDYNMNISSRNMVCKELIELSDYIDWYPRVLNSGPFEYLIRLDLPSEFVTVTNLKPADRSAKGHRMITTWKSFDKSYGVTLVAAPGLKRTVSEANGSTVEIYYDRLPESYADSLKRDLCRSVQLLTDLFGHYKKASLVRIVYSPRPAGGYARSPLLLVSEKYALEQMGSEFGYARDLRLDIHEIAHNWSRADVNTPDDWINEGLAEFSAFLVSEELAGKPFADMLLKEYREIVQNTPSRTSILETEGNSWEKDVNRYYKPTLLLNEIREKYGEDKLRRFISDLTRQFEESQTATTEIFLDLLGKSIGPEARDAFSDALHRKTWNLNAKSEITYIQGDTSFIGTWSGPLTQFGSTARFILNIKMREGKPVPTLDSPDQDVKDVPVSDFIIRNDTVTFRVGVASAAYKGHLDRNSDMISGIWTQRGVDYPLNITRK